MSQFSIVDEARALVPLISAERAAGNQQARLTKQVVAACGQAGLFRMAAPREVGGLEARLTDMIATTEVVSSADPAVGWYLHNAMSGWRAAAQLHAADRAEVFGNPQMYFASAAQNQGKAIEVEDGYRLSGTWPAVTGVEDAEWAFMVGTIMEHGGPRLIDGQPDTRGFLVPTAALDIVHTWQGVSTMRGTGSNMVKVTDIFVPSRLVVGPNTPFQIDRPYTRAPELAVIMPVVGGVALGVLGPVLDTLTTVLTAHTSAFTGEARRDQAASQELMAHCRAQFRALRAGLFEVGGLMDDTLAQGADLTPTLRAEVYASSMYTVDACRRMASDIFAGGTRDAFVKDNPMEVGLKDLHAIGYITAAVRFIVHSAGRVLLGGVHDPGL